MKMIFKIARIEIKQLFYSPIAWFLLIVFLVQCSMAYSEVLDGYARRQELGGSAMTSMKLLTSWIFGVQYGIFSTVLKNLFLYIPLLTMGLISRETSSGTIKLLYSSPITVTQIVMGKYVSMLVYSFFMLCIIALMMIVGCFNIQSPDIPMMLTALLGIYLLLCTYAAIGVFMSSLTTYQILAGVGTFVMIGILSYIGNVWQRYDFVRDITYFLSLTGRTEHMLRGLITTKDVLYFLVIIYVFLCFTILRMKAGRESRTFAVKAGWYTGVLVSGLLLGYISSRPGLIAYFDATDTKTESLSPKVRQIVEDLGSDKLEVTVYANLLDNFYQLGTPEFRNRLLEVWEPYVRYKPDISFKYVSYYDSAQNAGMMILAPGEKQQNLQEQAAARAKSYDYTLADYQSPAEIRKMIDLRPENNRFVMHLQYKGRSTFLRVFDDMNPFPGEPEFAAAFKRLQQAKFPKILFVTGNLERNPFKSGDREYKRLANEKAFRFAFVNQGFDVDTISLDRDEVPDDAAVLVLADPRQQLSAAASAKLNDYIRKGGSLLVTGEPGKQDVVNPLLRPLGVQLMEGVIAQPGFQETPDMVYAPLTANVGLLTKELISKYRYKCNVVMPGVTGLQFTTDSGFSIKPLLTNDPEISWLKKGELVLDSAAIQFNEAAGDERRMFPLMLAMTRKVNGKEQRIIVSGDADFLSNRMSGMFQPQTINFQFDTEIFSWLSGGEYPIDAAREESKDRRLNISSDQVKILRVALVWIAPAILAIIGSILLLRRKRK
ncbi:Gldg family protein [Chitinophaga horti]|uniref:Gldg family protein n=1 Tax=Chitinophaga horti TaxID=2920382 RepID=A0ABY6J3E4_9BACT|nr:Gldg family protein [Chitinophaga horti]UYQ94190.1 Gldg family protein [Chitinophaga horti]